MRTSCQPFYEVEAFERSGEGWTAPFDPSTLKQGKAASDIRDAETGEVVVKADSRITPRAIKKLQDSGVKRRLADNEELMGRFIATDIINLSTGEIYAEAGAEIEEELLETLATAGIDKIDVLGIDHVNVGPYIRNTLQVDKNKTRYDALTDIYRVMRPGEPPTPRIRGSDVQELVL